MATPEPPESGKDTVLDCMEMTPAEQRAALAARARKPLDDWHCLLCNGVRGFKQWTDDPTLCTDCAANPARGVYNSGQ